MSKDAINIEVWKIERTRDLRAGLTKLPHRGRAAGVDSPKERPWELLWGGERPARRRGVARKARFPPYKKSIFPLQSSMYI